MSDKQWLLWHTFFYNDYKKILRQGKYNDAHKDKQPVML